MKVFTSKTRFRLVGVTIHSDEKMMSPSSRKKKTEETLIMNVNIQPNLNLSSEFHLGLSESINMYL